MTAQGSGRIGRHGARSGDKAARRAALFLIGFGCLFAVSACVATAPTTARSPLANGTAFEPETETLLKTICGRCHVLSSLKRYEKSPRQWERTINRMRLLGAEISDEEIFLLRDHLSSPVDR